MDAPRFTRAQLNEVAAEPIKGWLGHENNRLLPEASLVYQSWLEAGGKLDVVAGAINDWLGHENNLMLSEAPILCRAWLGAGGRFALIREHVFAWVRSHDLERNAVFLLKDIVKQRVLPDDITVKILDWCARFANDPDAIWRLNSLSAHVSADLFTEAMRASEAVLEPLFVNPDLSGVTRSQVTTVLGNLAKLEHLGSPPSRELDAVLCRWMNHPQSFEAISRHGSYHQTRQFLARLLAAAEDAETTPELTPLIEWVARWDEQTRANCKDFVKQLRALRHNAMHPPRKRG